MPEPIASAYLDAARVPAALAPQTFGDWDIKRVCLPENHRAAFAWPEYTILQHKVQPTMANLHRPDNNDCAWDVVYGGFAARASQASAILDERQRPRSNHRPWPWMCCARVAGIATSIMSMSKLFDGKPWEIYHAM